MSSSYALESLVWNGLCLMLGFTLGRLTRRADQGGAVTPTRRRIRLRFEHYVAIFVVLLGIFTAVQSYRQSACMRDYANFFADALDARSKPSASAQDANDELWSTIGKLMTGGQAGPEAREKFQTALNDFLAKRAAAKEQQQRNPYPPPPRDLCK